MYLHGVLINQFPASDDDNSIYPLYPGELSDSILDDDDDYIDKKRCKSSASEADIKPKLKLEQPPSRDLLSKPVVRPSKGSLKELNSTSAPNKLLKVVVKTSISRINYTDAVVPQKLKHVSTFNMPVRKGFYKTELFYNSMLQQAQNTLRKQGPCESLTQNSQKFFFENPLITYRVVQESRDEKKWVRYPLTSALQSMEAPTQIQALVPHSQFFIEYEVAVHGPQHQAVRQPQQEVPEPPPQFVEQRQPTHVLSLADESLIHDMTELADMYPVLPMHIVAERLSKALHGYRRMRDPIVQRMSDELGPSKPMALAQPLPPVPRHEPDAEDNWRIPRSPPRGRPPPTNRVGPFDPSRLRGTASRGQRRRQNF